MAYSIGTAFTDHLLIIQQSSVKDYFSQKFRNLRRDSQTIDPSGKQKVISMAHATPVAMMQSPKSVEKDDKVSYERNTKMLLEEFSRNQSRDEIIRTLMKLTFDQRRAEINSSTAHTTKIMKDYPFFKKKKWVSYYYY